MPELDDEALFGDRADDIDDDDARAALDGDDDEAPESEDEEAIDLEAQFEKDEQPEKPAVTKGEKGGDRSTRGGEKTVTLSRKDYEALQARAREKEVEEAYWRGKAEAGSKGKRESDEDEEDAAPPVRKAKPAAVDDEDADAILADINKSPIKALKARGFVSRDEVEALINERAAAIAEKTAGRAVKQATDALHSDAQLIARYPDLNKQESEFSQRVAKEVRDMVKADPALRTSNAAIMAAARIVDAEMRAERHAKRSTDAERERRISKQGPSSKRSERDEDSYLSPLQRQMMGPALRAMGVSERDYARERAKVLKGNR